VRRAGHHHTTAAAGANTLARFVFSFPSLRRFALIRDAGFAARMVWCGSRWDVIAFLVLVWGSF